MPFSISCAIPGRVGEPKTSFNTGELAPSGAEAIEIRVDTSAYSSKLEFWSDFERLKQRMRELAEPRPEFAGNIAVPGTERITEDGELRITEDGQVRIL